MQRDADYATISTREAEIVDSLVSGLTAREIAADMRISFHTVRTHIKNIYEKLGVCSRVELIHWSNEYSSSTERGSTST